MSPTNRLLSGMLSISQRITKIESNVFFCARCLGMSFIVFATIFAERFPHKPLITELRNATAMVGGRVVLECRVISDLTPFVQWYHHVADANGSYVNDTSGEPYGLTIPVI